MELNEWNSIWTLHGAGFEPGPCMYRNLGAAWILIWSLPGTHSGTYKDLIVDLACVSTWLKHGCQPGHCKDLNLDDAWVSAWILHGSQLGPCTELVLSLERTQPGS